MSRIDLKQRIGQGVLLLDGAMGTQLIARGVEVGTCNDYLNIESPDIVCEIHRAYLAAGSDAVLTNTFGANRYALSRHGHSDKVEQINAAGAEAVRRAAGQDRYVLGDIGPCGDFLEPVGSVKPDELKEAFAEQANALAAGGVDGFIIETMTALDEIEVAIEAVKSVSELAIFASMSFDRAGEDFKTMMGVDVESAVSKIVSLDVDAVGFNCGTLSLDHYFVLTERIVSAVKTSGREVAILAEPNAGQPELVEGNAVYKVSCDEFAAAMEKIHSAGVTILGGCCGTGPPDIEAVAKKLK
jgi:5-methyltetrahydrofolate--homocysteine methyltransferase